MSKKEAKTNAVRILERMDISYEAVTYECSKFIDGVHIADMLGMDHAIVYKTITAVGKSGSYYVFVLPIDSEIDFKKAARAAGEKSLELLPLKELTKVTGYVRGGCTCVGMKKQFPVFIDKSAETLEKMAVSGGKIGLQILIAPSALASASGGVFAEISGR